MNKQNPHRAVAGTKRARQIAAQNGVWTDTRYNLTPEQQAWNDAVDAKKKAKNEILSKAS